MKKQRSKKDGVPGLIFIDFWLILGHFGAKRGEKRVPEGIDFLGEKWSQKKPTKNRNKSSPGGSATDWPELFEAQMAAGG